MVCRGGGLGGRGEPRHPHGRRTERGELHGVSGDDGRPSGFVWLPPASAPRPVPQHCHQAPPTPMGYRAPMDMHLQAAYAHGAALSPVIYRVPAPHVVYTPPPASVLVTTRAPPPLSPSPAPPPVPAPATAPAPRTPLQGAPASSAAPSAAALAKEVEKKLFVSETALAPPAAAAAVAVAASQPGATSALDPPDVDLAPVSKKGLAMIRANHFLVNVAENNLFHDDVSTNPESKSRSTNVEVLNELIKLHGKTSLGEKLHAYDGRESLFTAGLLLFDESEYIERAERVYKITIRIAEITDLYHLQQFLYRRQRDMPQETIQVLDVVLRESPSLNYVSVCEFFFSKSLDHRGDIGEGLECWRGSYQPTQMGLSLNIDISDRDRVKIKNASRGVRIETSHQQDQIRRYKITGITSIPMQLIFPINEEGIWKSVVQYFWHKYNYRLKYAAWSCLQAGSDSRPVYLPMQVCKIVEGLRYPKELNDQQVTNILRATCKRPQEGEQSIRDMVLHNKYAEDRFAREFGINVCSDLLSVPAGVLPPPLLKYHESGREKTCAPRDGQWNMINKVLQSSCSPGIVYGGLLSAKAPLQETKQLQISSLVNARGYEISSPIKSRYSKKIQKNGYIMFMLWLLTVTTLVCLPTGRADEGNCDSVALANKISGFCSGGVAHGYCCPSIINAIDTGSGCFCQVMKQQIMKVSGIGADEMIVLYKACRGQQADSAQNTSQCDPPPPPPPPPKDSSPPPPPPPPPPPKDSSPPTSVWLPWSGINIAVLTCLGVVVIIGSTYVVYLIWWKGANQYVIKQAEMEGILSNDKKAETQLREENTEPCLVEDLEAARPIRKRHSFIPAEVEMIPLPEPCLVEDLEAARPIRKRHSFIPAEVEMIPLPVAR
ncbi:hypothetical protein ACP4OV_009296 [Aristida adscensionis]